MCFKKTGATGKVERNGGDAQSHTSEIAHLIHFCSSPSQRFHREEREKKREGEREQPSGDMDDHDGRQIYGTPPEPFLERSLWGNKRL